MTYATENGAAAGLFQHRVTITDNAFNKIYHGCFRTSEEADDFIKEKSHTSTVTARTFGLGACPWGTWEEPLKGRVCASCGDYFEFTPRFSNHACSFSCMDDLYGDEVDT